MDHETFTFIVFGDKNKTILSSFMNEEKDVDSFNWVNYNEEYQKDENINFSNMNSDKIINHIKGKYGENIKIFNTNKTGYINHNEFAIFVNNLGEFVSIKKFVINYLYSNYVVSDDKDAFLIKDHNGSEDNLIFDYSNNVVKKEIDFYNMSDLSVNEAIRRYDLYHYTKNRLNLGDLKKLKEFIIDNYSNLFGALENFEIYELPFEDYCLFASVETFYPDFYFNFQGNLKMVFNKDLKTFIENIKVFVKELNKTPNDQFLTMYKYLD